jgi:hypothetical protein
MDVAAWAPTKRLVHLSAQMLGKLRVALSPAQPNWMFTALALSARGIRTGPIPWRLDAFEASLDLFAGELTVQRSDGRESRVGLASATSVADVYRGLRGALDDIGVDVAISPVPQELADQTPFDEDTRPVEYDREAALRWFRVTTAVAGAFERWRAHFFGRSGVQLWWGAFDLSLMLFSGTKVTPPADRGYLLKYDLDAELMNAGLYYGDERTAPFFYGYVHPEPPDAAALPIGPSAAAWSPALHEWVLPYETVRRSADPTGEIDAFLDAIYANCIAAGWDRDALSYVAPKRKRAP